MKARIKSTGEIIDFLGSSIEYGTCTWIDSKGDFNQGPNPGIEILESGKPIDWEQRRYEIAKDVLITLIPMCANVSRETKDNTIQTNVGFSFEGFSKGAVNLADALIAELKKK